MNPPFLMLPGYCRGGPTLKKTRADFVVGRCATFGGHAPRPTTFGHVICLFFLEIAMRINPCEILGVGMLDMSNWPAVQCAQGEIRFLDNFLGGFWTPVFMINSLLLGQVFRASFRGVPIRRFLFLGLLCLSR